jgi:hypothetical protein
MGVALFCRKSKSREIDRLEDSRSDIAGVSDGTKEGFDANRFGATGRAKGGIRACLEGFQTREDLGPLGIAIWAG